MALPPPPPPPPHAVSTISKSPGKVKCKTSRRVVFTCPPFSKRQLLISPAYHRQPPVGSALIFPYTPVTRTPSRRGASLSAARGLRSCSWRSSSVDDGAGQSGGGYLGPSSASLRYIGNGGPKGTAVRTAQARRYPTVIGVWVAKRYGHSVEVMLHMYAAWLEGAMEADIHAIKHGMARRPALVAIPDQYAATTAANAAINRTRLIVIRPPESREFGSSLAIENGRRSKPLIQEQIKWRRGWVCSRPGTAARPPRPPVIHASQTTTLLPRSETDPHRAR